MKRRITRHRRNPRGTTSDHAAASELAQFTVNTSKLYYQQAQPIIQNLVEKKRKGVYTAAKALKLWGYLADSGARAYIRENYRPGDYAGPHGSYGPFSAATRREAAREIAEHYAEELANQYKRMMQ